MIRLYFLLAMFGTVAESFPIAVYWFKRTPDPGRRQAALFCFTLLSFDIAGAMTRHSGNNVWLGYFYNPTMVLAAALPLHHWQASRRGRLLVRGLVGTYLIAIIPFSLEVENHQSWSLVSGSVSNVMALALALFTLVTRSLVERESLVRQDWFWICTGIALVALSGTGLDPLLRFLISRNASHTAEMSVIMLKIMMDICAMFLIARGMLCPLAGGESLPIVAEFRPGAPARH